MLPWLKAVNIWAKNFHALRAVLKTSSLEREKSLKDIQFRVLVLINLCPVL